MIKKSRIFEVYESSNKKKKYTLSIAPKTRVYGEGIFRDKNKEYREWDAFKSKLCSAIFKGCQDIKIRKGSSVLYLGSSSGTTVSHVADIVGMEGIVFANEISARPMIKLVFVSEKRKNVVPILEDANHPESYVDKVCQVDVVFQDISQKNQVEIFKKNISLFLKKGGFGIIAIKAKSIDVSKNPTLLFKEARSLLEQDYIIVDYRTLEPFQLDHCFMIVKRK